MKRSDLESFILETYSADADHPWRSFPDYQVFRHSGNRKWFALIMDIPKEKLGLHGGELIDVVNLKCDSVMIGLLLDKPGFFPAYHMSRSHWITVALDGSVPDDEIKTLLDRSYQATLPKMTSRRNQ
ncbi:MAG: MmcQ/YjbR family DNA-binding protein [Eubacterium sp.]